MNKLFLIVSFCILLVFVVSISIEREYSRNEESTEKAFRPRLGNHSIIEKETMLYYQIEKFQRRQLADIFYIMVMWETKECEHWTKKEIITEIQKILSRDINKTLREQL